MEKEKYQSNMNIQSELTKSENKCYQLTMELNHAMKKTDSLSRELKKVLKDSKETQYAFEVALDRKSVECIVSIYRERDCVD